MYTTGSRNLHVEYAEECSTAVQWLNTQQEVVDPLGAKPERPKLGPEGPRAEVVFPSADQGFSSIQGTVFGSVAFK